MQTNFDAFSTLYPARAAILQGISRKLVTDSRSLLISGWNDRAIGQLVSRVRSQVKSMKSAGKDGKSASLSKEKRQSGVDGRAKKFDLRD